jgi:transglutaminase-like putative cysteine protease
MHEHSGPVLHGYLGDIGVDPDPAPMDFSAWFEVYLGKRWFIRAGLHLVAQSPGTRRRRHFLPLQELHWQCETSRRQSK